MKYFWLVCLTLATTAALAQNQFVYTNDNVTTGEAQSSNTVSAFLIAPDGSLSLIPGSPFKTGGSGGGSNIDPEEIAVTTRQYASFLYAANDGSGTISAFKINPSTGFLTHVNGSPFLADGAPGGDYSLAITPDSKFLYATAETTTVIHIYSIGVNGSLTEVSGSPFPTGANSQGLKVTANGRFLIVGQGSSNTVAVYAIASTGTLTPVPGSPFPASSAPFAIDANCASSLVFVVDTQSFIDVYSMSNNGALTAIFGNPFSNGTSSTNGGLALSTDDKFLFVTDTFSSDISSLSIGSFGPLSQVPNSPFPTSNWPGGTAVTRSGRFLYSAFFTSAQVDGRSFNFKGELSPVPGTPFSTGQAQTGVATLTTFPRPFCSGS
jgi:6-phosphogluconolactonase (cycloisomerase 2 family)